MIQSLTYDGEICEDNCVKLFKNLDDLILLKTQNPDIDLKVILYYSSEGGQCYWADYQSDYLNRCLQYYPIEIMTGANIMSAAVDVLMKFKGKITVPPLTLGMIHKASTSFQIKDATNKFSYGTIISKQVSKENNKFLRKISKHLSIKEIEIYKNGYEVFLNSVRLKKILLDRGETNIPVKTKRRIKTK